MFLGSLKIDILQQFSPKKSYIDSPLVHSLEYNVVLGTPLGISPTTIVGNFVVKVNDEMKSEVRKSYMVLIINNYSVCKRKQ